MIKTNVTDLTDAKEINGARFVKIGFTLKDGTKLYTNHHPKDFRYWGVTPAQLLSNGLNAMISAGHDIDAGKPFTWTIAS